MGQGWRSRARRDPDLDDDASPLRRRAPLSDEDEEVGNEDLSLEIVARARLREAAGGRPGLADLLSLSSSEKVDEDAVVELGEADTRRKQKKNRRKAKKKQRKEAPDAAAAAEKEEIYILLYKEVSLALKINSMYSKRRLLNIHENVKVLRYPDHFSTGIYLWSHHEKIAIVDNQVFYIGGLDLCFGRYDTPEHKVMDFPPSIWPGKDYYNPRESEPNSWEDTMKDELDRAKYPRMPWHDVQCALYGPAC